MSEIQNTAAHVKAYWLGELQRLLAMKPSIDCEDGRVLFRGLWRKGIPVAHAFGISSSPEGANGFVIAHQWHDARLRGPRNLLARCGAVVYHYDPQQPDWVAIDYCDEPGQHLYSSPSTLDTAWTDLPWLMPRTFDPAGSSLAKRGILRLHEGTHQFTNELIVAGIGQLSIAGGMPPAA